MKNIVILISGRGSNMEALIAARDAGAKPSTRRWPNALIVSSPIWSFWPVSCAS